jgi:hypothetical protein
LLKKQVIIKFGIILIRHLIWQLEPNNCGKNEAVSGFHN